MRYVLLLLTLLTAGFSVWYYQNRISPEGKELAAQKTTLEQEAAILEDVYKRQMLECRGCGSTFYTDAYLPWPGKIIRRRPTCPVSYTHLDVYKRQNLFRTTDFTPAYS